MSGTTRSSADLDVRRRRILYRSWHRGIREMDLLLGQFADARIDQLSDQDLADLEVLLELPDRDVFSWLTGEAALPAEHDTPVFRQIREFHRHSGAIFI
ncbi:succinate dehydrogenase assembly factor 2 [Camelimonas abortus]|uniref:FAD assembly factor SdhE n=1 Tax=Camelimonas abortus TaxID=1017184 RepID=A0ABV7LD95_9HYPH